MSVSLLCSACGAEIGVAGHEDNYQNHFHKLSKKGKPVCPNCNNGDNPGAFTAALFFAGLSFFISVIIYIFIIV